MSAVCIITPLVVSSWPMISAAFVGAAASMGFAVSASSLHCDNEDDTQTKRSVETEVENSEVIAEDLRPGQQIVVQREDLTIRLTVDECGRCTVCVTGDGHTDRQLRQIGEETAGRIVQQFAYSKLVTELKRRNYSLVEESILSDESVRLRVRL